MPVHRTRRRERDAPTTARRGTAARTPDEEEIRYAPMLPTCRYVFDAAARPHVPRRARGEHVRCRWLTLAKANQVGGIRAHPRRRDINALPGNEESTVQTLPSRHLQVDASRLLTLSGGWEVVRVGPDAAAAAEPDAVAPRLQPARCGRLSRHRHHRADPAGHSAHPVLFWLHTHDRLLSHACAARSAGGAGRAQRRRGCGEGVWSGVRHRDVSAHPQVGAGARLALLHAQPGEHRGGHFRESAPDPQVRVGALVTVASGHHRRPALRGRAADILGQPAQELSAAHRGLGRLSQRPLGRLPLTGLRRMDRAPPLGRRWSVHCGAERARADGVGHAADARRDRRGVRQVCARRGGGAVPVGRRAAVAGDRLDRRGAGASEPPRLSDHQLAAAGQLRAVHRCDRRLGRSRRLRLPKGRGELVRAGGPDGTAGAAVCGRDLGRRRLHQRAHPRAERQHPALFWAGRHDAPDLHQHARGSGARGTGGGQTPRHPQHCGAARRPAGRPGMVHVRGGVRARPRPGAVHSCPLRRLLRHRGGRVSGGTSGRPARWQTHLRAGAALPERKAAASSPEFAALSIYAINAAGEQRTNVRKPRTNAVTWGIFPDREVIQPTVVCPESFKAWSKEAFALWIQNWASIYDHEQGTPAEQRSVQLIRDIHDTFWLVNVVDNNFVRSPHRLTGSKAGRTIGTAVGQGKRLSSIRGREKEMNEEHCMSVDSAVTGSPNSRRPDQNAWSRPVVPGIRPVNLRWRRRPGPSLGRAAIQTLREGSSSSSASRRQSSEARRPLDRGVSGCPGETRDGPLACRWRWSVDAIPDTDSHIHAHYGSAQQTEGAATAQAIRDRAVREAAADVWHGDAQFPQLSESESVSRQCVCARAHGTRGVRAGASIEHWQRIGSEAQGHLDVPPEAIVLSAAAMRGGGRRRQRETGGQVEEG
eukprot:ctg_452.g221